MEGKDSTPPIATAPIGKAVSSSPMTPNPKRARIGSPDHKAEKSVSQLNEGDSSTDEKKSEHEVSQTAEDGAGPEDALIEDDEDLEAVCLQAMIGSKGLTG